MGAAAGDEDAADRRAADQARFARPEIDLVFQLEKALFSRCVHVIGDGRAAQCDRFAQHCLDGGAQSLQFCSGEAASLASRTNAGAKQAFIRINVADAMEKLLIQQRGFDGGSAPAKECSKRVWLDV